MSRWLGWSLLFSVVVLGALGAHIGLTEKEWYDKIQAAKQQRLLSQRMAKEFLLVALGNEDKYKNNCRASMVEFQDLLTSLTSGKSRTENPDVARLYDLILNEWAKFEPLITTNIDLVYGFPFEQKRAVVRDIKYRVDHLYDEAQAIVEELYKVSQQTIPLGADISIRQEILIAQMAKEAYLVALGYDLETDLHNLDHEVHEFRDSHNGLVLGAAWAGIPVMTNVCTMKAFSDVTQQWEGMLTYFDPIIVAISTTVSQELAAANWKKISLASDSLYDSSETAAQLYKYETDACDTRSQLTVPEWRMMLRNVGEQRFLGEVTTQHFLQIVLNVEPQTSRVELTVETVTAEANIRKIMEGKLSAGSHPAPTQEILDMCQHAYKAWSDMKNELDQVITTGQYNDQSVARIASMNKIHLKDMNSVADMFVANAKQYAPSLKSTEMNKVGHNRELFQEISVEACLIQFGHEVDYNWDAMNASIDTWYEDNYILLEGDHGYGIPRMEDICIVQQMKDGKDQFDLLKNAALATAFGSNAAVHDIIKINVAANPIMQKCEEYFSSSDPITCELHHNTAYEWEMELFELGRMRAHSLAVVFDLYCDMLNNTVCDVEECDLCCDMLDNTYLARGVRTLERSLKNLKYGNGDIPAPHNQAALDKIYAVADKWTPFKAMLMAQNTAGSEKESNVLMNGVNDAINKDLEEDDNPEHIRLNDVSMQMLRAQRILNNAAKHAWNLRSGNTTAQGISLPILKSSITAYENAHAGLASMAAEIEERTGRTDLAAIMGDTQAKFVKVIENVDIMAGISVSQDAIGQNIYVTMEALRGAYTDLITVIDDAVHKFAEKDPADIPPKPEGPPWTLIIYACIGGGVLILCCLACYSAGVCRARGGSGAAAGGAGYQTQDYFAGAKDLEKKKANNKGGKQVGIRDGANAKDNEITRATV